MKSKLLFSFIFILSCIPSLFSQEIAIGEWRDHLPYQSTISVTAGDQKIYCATPYSIFYLDEVDNSINRLTRTSGLSDIGIARIGYNESAKTLLVAYENANIDLVKGNTVINMKDILNSEAVTPEEKRIYNLVFIDNIAYITCGFGIVVLNLSSEEISDTYYIGPSGSHIKVFDLTHNDTSFFAATENGIYSARMDNPNLAYYSSWTKDESLPFPSAAYNFITFNGDKLFANKYSPDYAKDTIVCFENGQWNYHNDVFDHLNVYALRSFNNLLYLTSRYNVKVYDNDFNIVLNIWTYNDNSGLNPRDLTVDKKNVIWIADDKKGLVMRHNDFDYYFYSPNGPSTADVFDLSSEGNDLWSVAGGRNSSWGDIWKYGNASHFNDSEWKTLDRTNTPAFDTILDLVTVAINPFDHSDVFVGSWTRGLIEIKNQNVVTTYNPSNSSLEFNNILGGPTLQIGGLAFDNSGNLWVACSHSQNILSVRMPDGSQAGSWKSFNLGSFSSNQDIGELAIDTYGQKWILTRAQHTLFAFTDNGTIADISDDHYKVLSSSPGSGNLPGSVVYSLAVDNTGEIWIGTDGGIAVIYSPENVFTNYNFDAQQILIPRNDGTGLADILLEFETVTAIAVDGANDKWIGTDRSGVFHLSHDGLTELDHFTVQNSPLLSNNITSIAINANGEVFFGTAKGIISYRAQSTPGKETNSEVYAFPNPVRPGYSGPIAITGLVSNADIKITDISGNLIYSGKAEGGQAIWDGNNFEGRRAQSGVYLVFISDDSGSQTMVTKILLIN